MDRRRSQLLAVGVLLLAAAYALPLPDEPVGGEATHLLATASLWHDRDLRFDPGDLARGYALWAGGPRGLSLTADPDDLADPDEPGGPAGGAPVFATPVVYPLFAAPVYGALGPRGLRVLNVALYLAMLGLALRWLVAAPRRLRPSPEGAPTLGRAPVARTRRPPRRVGRLLGGVFFATGAVVWVLRFQPQVLLATCVFVAVALWCRVRSGEVWGGRELLALAVAGSLLGGPAVSDPALGLFALPILVDLVWGRRFRVAAVFTLVFLAVAAIAAGLQHRATGDWGPGVLREARVYAEAPFPFEVGAEAGVEGSTGETVAGEAVAEASPSLVAHRAFWLFAGRHVGLLPYFPFALYLIALYLIDLSEIRGRMRHLLAAALLVYLALAVAGFPESAVPGTSGAAAAGARAVALVYPLFLFLPLRLRAGRGVVLPFLAAGLWALPAVAVAAGGAVPRYALELPARGPTYGVLPMELELLAAGRLPGYTRFDPPGERGVWWVPVESFFVHERNPDGVWVRGAGRSEVYVVADRPIEELRFRVRSLADRNELVVHGDGDRTRVRFDTAGKRSGAPVRVWPELLAEGLGLFLAETAEAERVYRFVLEVSGGAVPARLDPGSSDPRYLGVFLELR